MAAIMNADSGFAPFLDNLIVVLAGRHGARISLGQFTDADVGPWENVAKSVQTMLRFPSNDEERLQMRHVEPHMFTARICRHRAAYLLWRARREANSRTGASGFDVTKHSIAQEIEDIYQSAKDRLPTISMDSDEDDDGEADGGAAVVQPVQFQTKSAEEVLRDQKIAEAEDELMRKVQELQVEFFEKHRKWVEAPLQSTPSGTPQKSGTSAKPPRGASEPNFCIENINRKLLIEVTPEDLAVVFDSLDISEHKMNFRRTTGRVLKTLEKSELMDRFGKDREAADLLWAWIEERRVNSPPASKSSTPMKHVEPLSEEAAARQQVSAMLEMFRRVGTAAPTPAATAHYLDPLAHLKRAMNPHRPLRPSQQDYDHEEALAALQDDGQDPVGFQEAVAARVAVDPRQGKTPLRTGTGSAARDTPNANPQSGGSAPRPGSAAAPPQPSRAGRWQVVEYDDDDEEE